MTASRMVLVAYAGLTLYFFLVVSVTTLDLATVVPAILQLALCWLAFAGGYLLGRRNVRDRLDTSQALGVPWLVKQPPLVLTILAGAAVIAIVFSSYYLTGQTPSSVYGRLATGQAVYFAYQDFTSQFQSGAVSQVAALLLLFVKGLALYGTVVFVIRGPLSLAGLLFTITVILSYLYFGISRGTSLEFFEVGILLLFSFMSRMQRSAGNWRWIVASCIAVGAMVALFRFGLIARAVELDLLLTQGDVSADEGTLLANWLSGLQPFILSLYSYLGFGALYVGTYWSQVWLASSESFLIGLVPGGYHLFALGESPRESTASLLDMGTRWHPDSAILIGYVGFFGLLAACLLLGLLARTWSGSTVPELILGYFIFVQMLAFPVGNFVWVSRSNVYLMVICLVVLLARRSQASQRSKQHPRHLTSPRV